MSRLKSAIVSKGITSKFCASVLGISDKSLENKMNGITEFTYGEVRKLHELMPEYSIDYLLADIPMKGGGSGKS